MKLDIVPYGNLDLENDIPFIKDGDYRDALDITSVSDGDGNSQSKEPTIGNIFGYELGFVAPRLKTLRVFLHTGASSYTIRFLRPNQKIIGDVNIYQDLNTVTMIDNAITAIISALGPGAAILIPKYGLTAFDITFFDHPTEVYGWGFYANNLGVEVAQFETISEPIDVGASGNFYPVKFYDLLPDQFVFSCTRSGFREEIAITNVINNGGLLQITIPNHGLKNGEVISITGLSDANGSLDGEWVALEVNDGLGHRDADNVILYQAPYNSPVIGPTAKATVNLYSVSQIGVAQEDVITVAQNTVSYTSLVTTKAFNLRRKKAPHIYMETEFDKKNIYFTDGINDIRVLYYYGPYQVEGIFNSLNGYTIDTLTESSKFLIADKKVGIDFIDLIYGGGAVPSGNIRYAACLVSSEGVETDYSDISNPINVFSATPNFQILDPTLQGDPDGTITNKKVKLSLSNLSPGLFKYVKLVMIQVSAGATDAFVIGKYLITSDVMEIVHTGFETLETFDVSLLYPTQVAYRTAESIDALDRRLIISNLTSDPVIDFSDFFKTFKHTLKIKTIPSIGINDHLGTAQDPTVFLENKYEEYLNPKNTFNNMGFLINETYRFLARVRSKASGLVSPVSYFLDDICFDGHILNYGNVFGGQNRRLGGLPTLSTDGGPNGVNVPYITWSGFDLNFIINGHRVIDLISEIIIDVVPLTEDKREVIANGIAFCCYKGYYGPAIPPTPTSFLSASIGTDPGVINNDAIAEWWNFVDNPHLSVLPQYGAGSGAPIASLLNRVNDVVSFYSPDCYLGGLQISRQPEDKIICFDSLDKAIVSTYNNQIKVGPTGATSQLYHSRYLEFYNQNAVGDTHRADTSSGQPAYPYEYPVSEVKFVAKGTSTSSTFAGGTTYFQKALYSDNLTAGSPISVVRSRWDWMESHVIKSTSSIIPPNGQKDGLFYAQYFRDKSKGVKYGDPATSKGTPTGSGILIDYNVNPVLSTIDTFGGDAYVQNTFLKPMMPFDSSVAPALSGDATYLGYGAGLRICTQNRINAQMRYYAAPVVAHPPITEMYTWLRAQTPDELNYSHSYDPGQGVTVFSSININDRIQSGVYQTRFAWSEPKPNNSLSDTYRRMLPFNIKDLDQNAGPVIHHEVVNSELMSWQPRAFMRQYFNSSALISSTSGSVLTGDGGAMTRRGATISAFGSSHKGSIIKGISKGGNDTVAWINTEYGVIARFGYDGTNPISSVHNIKGFAEKNMNIVDVRHSPADNEGITGVWNDISNDYIWTIRGWRANAGEFNPLKYYNSGDIVYKFDPGEQRPVLYKANQTSNALVNSQLVAIDVSDLSVWTPVTDPSYRNEFSFRFNEISNGFGSFMTPLPRIYGKWKKTYVSASPLEPQSIFIHNKGDVCRWYKTLNYDLSSTPYITCVFKQGPGIRKEYIAIEVNSLDQPNGQSQNSNVVEFTTDQHRSYLIGSDFITDEDHDNMWASWIKNDTTGTGINDGDSSSVYGRYLLIKYLGFTVWRNPTYSLSNLRDKLFGFVIKYNPISRTNDT